MNKVAILLCLAACGGDRTLLDPDAAPSTDAATDPLVESLAGKTVLWIGAHPDDELMVAPLLAEVCVDRMAHCKFLVATRGERGNCGLAQGCVPDVATVRTSELSASVALYNGTVVQWMLADGSAPSPADVVNNWAAASGGLDALTARIQDAITASAADVVITWDPRHGSTCHPDHRAISALVTVAINNLGSAAPPAYLAEARTSISPDQTAAGYVPAIADDPKLVTYDARRILASSGDEAWAALLPNLRVYASQYAARVVAAIGAAPEAERRVFLLGLADGMAANDPRYDALCP